VRAFGEIARQEYRAVGIHVALHPMADVATEPRWARIGGTFGEDFELVGRLTAAYIRGFQGEELGPASVACMLKHFPGGGPQADGEDPHFPYGKDQVYPGGRFDDHLRVFEAAFAAGTAQVMPYYGRPVGTELEPVGFGFNREVITGLLRGRFGFDGVVCTDWGLVSDTADARRIAVGGEGLGRRGARHRPSAWSRSSRPAATSSAASSCPSCSSSSSRQARLGGAHRRVGAADPARQVPARAVRRSVRRSRRGRASLWLVEFRAAGDRAQRRSAVLVTNDGKLPLAGRPRLYLDGVSAEAAAAYGEVVERPEDADIAVVRRVAPFEPRDDTFIESVFHAGDLDFKEPELGQLLDLASRVPTVLVLHLERPSVIPELADACAAVVAVFGASDAAVLDVLFGHSPPEARLPFELPSSMEAVRAQKPDVPGDSKDPLFLFGHALFYD
jgi:beta-glucosidase